MKALLLSLTLITSAAFAGFEHAPKPFKVGSKKAIWVDFQQAHYELEYDITAKRASAISTIEFIQHEPGYPLFDLTTKPSAVTINGEISSQKLVSLPGNVSKVRMVQTLLPAGRHTLTIVSEIKNGIKFKSRRSWGNVSNAFFIRDLKDRKFLEKYLPTNLEYDQYKMIMDVSVENTKRTHSLFVNGKKEELGKNKFRVTFPDWYTASSVFFHLIPINKFVRWYMTYTSIDGREIPFTIYSRWRFYNYFMKKKALKVMRELEEDYGPWPHDQILIYGTGIKGGMEYAGATETSIISLGHELQHAYFAKGIHPANGNAGWLDEAIASWRDKGHQTVEKPFYHSANLGKQNSYTRKTDKRSYKYGRSFMAYLDHQLKDMGKPGLKDFLRLYVERRMHTTVTTEIFKSDLEDYANMSFDEDFSQYIYGGFEKLKNDYKYNHDHHKNPHHPEITEEELNSII